MGAHKTGTTSIQFTLDNHRALLKELGVYYPENHPIFKGKRTGHFGYAHALTNTDSSESDKADRFIASITDTANCADSSIHTVLLSAEPAYRHIQGFRDEPLWADSTADDFWLQRKRYLQDLKKSLSDFDVEIVLFIRRQDSMVESLYQEATSRGFYRQPFQQFCHDFNAYFDFNQQINIITDVFNNVTVCRYEENCDVVPIFLELCFPGQQLPATITEKVRIRRSPDKRLTLWLQESSADEHDSQSHFLKSELAHKLFKEQYPCSFWDSVKQRDSFLHSFSGKYGAEFFTSAPTQLPTVAVLSKAYRNRIDDAYISWKKSLYDK